MVLKKIIHNIVFKFISIFVLSSFLYEIREFFFGKNIWILF